jgi:hypothetical protein
MEGLVFKFYHKRKIARETMDMLIARKRKIEDEN